MLRACIVGYGRAGRLQHDASMNMFQVTHVVDSRASVGNLLEASITYSSDMKRVLPDVDVVIVCTPTHTHYEVAKVALEHDKHVFLEKPIANTSTEIEELYDLACSRELLLFVAFNRRYDSQWSHLKDKVLAHYPSAVNVVCRDFPFPPASYLESCGGIFRDAAVHDIDMLCLMLCDTPVKVDASLDDSNENSSVVLIFSRGCRVHMLHSRHSTGYDQRVMATLKTGMVEMGGVVVDGETFQSRYKDSYADQMRDFARRVREKQYEPNVSLSHALMLERILCACDASAESGNAVELKTLRSYEAAQQRVRDLYYRARAFHTVQTTRYLIHKYKPGQHGWMSVKEALKCLESFVDLSDPDTTHPNNMHALQTAESIRKAGLPEWMQVIGLIHDFGKILYRWGCDEDGTSLNTQWSLVGDTFVVGHEVPESIVYPEFNVLATCDDMEYASKCGLDNCLVSFGHDEYLYRVLLESNTTLPAYGLKIVRYHSMYVWHQHDAYSELESEQDVLVKGWVKLFNTHDLYSKRNRPLYLETVWPYYERLCEKFIPSGLHF